MRKIYFVTTNKHKFEEVQDVLKDYPIELEQLDLEYEENHDLGMEEIAKTAAKKLANKLNKPIILEDTGLFFEAYPGFPGALPKFVITTLGYKGIFKLLEGESKKAYFQTVAAFCEPGKEPVTFEGKLYGEFTNKVHNKDKDTMPYNRIFKVKGEDRTISDMTLQEFNAVSHRAKVFRKFGEFIKGEENE